MAENPFENIGREFRQAIEDHAGLFREEMERIREQMHGAMEQMKVEMERVGGELQRAMKEFHGDAPSPPDWFGDRVKADRASRSSGRKRPRRKPPGGEPAPVKPRPKPKPLVDGAEAPIE
ncbi:MAG TPA: hypothetical protein VFW35_02700 [Sphingomicrobium sp.]|nr:hypothetical protein [Sphingomicrobium sp.]